MLRTNQHRLRRAIGLVELMVAMALSIGIMWILAESFKMGLDFTRHAHSTGTMMSQLDGARAIMSRDLLADHFLPDDNKPNRGVRLSDQRLDYMTNTSPSVGWYPPTGGFFRIISPIQSTSPLPDSYGSLNTAVNHALHFTSVLDAKDQNLYSVNVNGFNYYSRAVEVGYFLVDTGISTSPDPVLGQKLYNLVRRQRLVAMTSDETQSLMGGVADNTVIAGNGSNQVYRLADVTNPANRLPIPAVVPVASGSPATFGIGSPRYGEDLLLSNVLSFEVLVDWAPSAVTDSNAWPRSYPANSDYPFDYLAVNNGHSTSSGLFDTWYQSADWNIGLNVANSKNTTKLPLAVRVKQLQITVRVFDPKTKQARQSTWKFSM